MRRLHLWGAAAVALLVLTSCGGSDSDSDGDSASSVTAPTLSADDIIADDVMLTPLDLPGDWAESNVPGNVDEAIEAEVPECDNPEADDLTEPTGSAGPVSFTENNGNRFDLDIRIYAEQSEAEAEMAVIEAVDRTPCLAALIAAFGALPDDVTPEITTNTASGYGDESVTATATTALPDSTLVIEFTWVRVGRGVFSVVAVVPEGGSLDTAGQTQVVVENLQEALA